MSTPCLWRGPDPLLLASASPARRRLLEAAGLPVETCAAGIEERAIEADLALDAAGRGDLAQRLAERLAREKALAVSRRCCDRIVVGADQTLACEGCLFHKPADAAVARGQIARLAGRTHTLHSAFAVARGGSLLAAGVEEAHLTMRPLDADAIELYVACAGGQAVAGVGAYQVENLGLHLFDRVEGEHSTILGLPLLPLLATLRKLELLAF